MVYGHKELKLSLGQVGPGALQVSFSNLLSLRQDQWSCRRPISLSTKKPQWRRKASGGKYPNFLSSAVLPHEGQLFRSQPRPWLQWPLPALPSPHLRYSRAPPAASFLGHVSNQTSRQKFLYGQYWWNEVEASRAAGVGWRSSKTQGYRRAAGRLDGYWWGAAPPAATVHIRNHSNKAH